MIRTLVVDDDFRVAAIHAAYIESVPGYEMVGRAHTANECFRHIEQLRPHLVLLDLFLPDRHGLEVLRCLRQPRNEPPDLDVIVITAAHDVESARTAMQCGALHYLLKPFGFPALRDKLVAYRAMRQELDAVRHADQLSIDRLYGALHPDPGTARMRSNPTLDAVEEVLMRAEADVSAADVGNALGVSRATAQRYLAQLEALRRATMSPRYGAAGRPEHRYRAAASAPVRADNAPKTR